MSERRHLRVLFTVFLCVTAFIGFVKYRQHHRRAQAEVQSLAQREVTYRATAEALQRAIPPGTSRDETESILGRNALPYELRPGTGTHDEIVPLAHEASPHWYCNYEQAEILIEFTPADPAAPALTDATGFSSAAPNDRVKNIRLNHRQRDCI